MKMFLTFLLTAISIISFCQSPTSDEVKQMATAFLNQKNSRQSTKLKNAKIQQIKEIKPVSIDGQVLFHVVELKPTGFVVLSNDTSIDPVITYSESSTASFIRDTSNFLFNFITTDLKLRKTYSSKIKNKWSDEFNQLKSAGVNEFRQWPEEGTTNTGGWIKTTWHQDEPFNNFCPSIEGKKAPAGCAPIAIAQILNYHKFAGSNYLTSANRYKSNSSGTEIEIDADSINNQFPSFIKLNSFLDGIRNKFAVKQDLNEEEVAALTFISGIAANSQYSENNTSTSQLTTFIALLKFWGLTDVKSLMQHYNFINDSMVVFHGPGDPINNSSHSAGIIAIDNLKNGFPCLIEFPGHLAVLDGYNTDNFFHCNFGWGSETPQIKDAWYHIPDFEGYQNIVTIIADIIPPDKKILSSNRLVIKNKNDVEKLSISKMTNPLTVKTPENFSVSKDGINFSDSISIPASSGYADIYFRFDGDTISNVPIEIKFKDAPSKIVDVFGIPDEESILSQENLPEVINVTQSPFFVNEALQIKEGQKLIIEPGVKLLFTSDGGISVNKNSYIEAVGSVDKRIIFDAVNKYKGWRGIYIMNHHYQPNRFVFCNFLHRTMNLRYRDDFDKSVLESNLSELFIENCNFINNYRNLIINNEPVKYLPESSNSVTQINNCLIANSYCGIEVSGSNKTVFNYCTVVNNKTGIKDILSKAEFYNSIIINNAKDFESIDGFFSGISFNNCIKSWKNEEAFQLPVFKNPDLTHGVDFEKDVYDRSLQENSVAKNQGNVDLGITEYDILGNKRVSGLFPDIGAFEDSSEGISIKTVPGPEYDFGEVLLNQTKAQVLHIYNPDYNPLKIKDVILSDTSGFYKTIKTIENNKTIAPLTKDSVLIEFTPGIEGLATAVLEIISDAPKQSTYKVNLKGVGYKGTLIKGEVSGIWDSTGSPYTIIDNCFIEKGKSLTVKEGVEIIYTGDFSLEIRGNLFIKGSEQNKVKFKTLGEFPGLALYSNYAPIPRTYFSSAPNIVIVYAEIDSFYNFLKVEYTNFEILNCVFKGNKGTILSSQENYNKISGNLFIDNIWIDGPTYERLIMIRDAWSCEISDNTFTGNKNSGGLLRCGHTTDIKLTGNSFRENRIEMNSLIDLQSFYNGVEFSNNIFENNLVFQGIARCSGSFHKFNNNIISNNTSLCPKTALFSRIRTDLGNFQFLNNTICKNLAPAIVQIGTSSFYNNIFWENKVVNAGDGIEVNSVFDSYTTEMSHNFFDYNEITGEENIISDYPGFCFPSDNLGFHSCDTVYDWKLKSNSICIDAGIDSVRYNDMEDNQNPGFALYPAMGTIRADLGAFGGTGNSIPTSINEINNIKFSIYPNPTEDQIQIRFEPGEKKKYLIQIINELSQTLFEKEIYLTGSLHEERIKLSHLSKGIYLVKVSNDKMVRTEKILLR